ncbi:hypothetical protein BM221_009893 [Beauveria bassiana]|uniref:Uncharacterized protein n=1 Tax=Beauveria bassiana TaxID=176275 RepID=A0A2N6NA12_BEABA|nr:hypothetical protein BM221_009893 [Beauveria bassiana]
MFMIASSQHSYKPQSHRAPVSLLAARESEESMETAAPLGAGQPVADEGTADLGAAYSHSSSFILRDLPENGGVF